MTVRQQVGQLIVVGVEGPDLTAMERAWMKLIQPSGVILFRRNIEEASRIKNIVAEKFIRRTMKIVRT